MSRKTGDLAPDSCGLHAVVPVTGVDLLGERVQAVVLAGIGHLSRYKSFGAELAVGVRLKLWYQCGCFGPPAFEAIRIGSGPSWK